VWREVPWEDKEVEPEFLGDLARLAEAESYIPGLKLCYMRMSSATNERSMIATLVRIFPSESNVIAIICPRVEDLFPLAATLNSFAYDWLLRTRFVGLALDYHVSQQVPIPTIAAYGGVRRAIEYLVLRLNGCHSLFAPEWLRASRKWGFLAAWRSDWALSNHERLKLRCILDAVVAELYGLTCEEYAWMLRDCDHPVSCLKEHIASRALDPKGFWRVDKEKEPELRHTVLAHVAFQDLKHIITREGGDRVRGVELFCSSPEEGGWQLPESLCLADYGLGHDDRAKSPQPVRSRTGERFFSWQLGQSVEESWSDCERHARNILGDEGFTRFMATLTDQESELPSQTSPHVAEPFPTYAPGTLGAQRRLFPGEPTLFGNPMEDPPPKWRRNL
jgi:hypothetical protein